MSQLLPWRKRDSGSRESVNMQIKWILESNYSQGWICQVIKTLKMEW